MNNKKTYAIQCSDRELAEKIKQYYLAKTKRNVSWTEIFTLWWNDLKAYENREDKDTYARPHFQAIEEDNTPRGIPRGPRGNTKVSTNSVKLPDNIAYKEDIKALKDKFNSVLNNLIDKNNLKK